MKRSRTHIPVGTKALILSKFYYGVISRQLEGIEIDRYFSILYFLRENDGCSQQHICNNLAIDKTAMVKVMDYLIMSGLVQRKVNPDDRRQHFIKLTRKGRSRVERIADSFQKLDKELFNNIKKEEKETFFRILDEVIARLEILPGVDLFFNYKKTTGKKLSRKT